MNKKYKKIDNYNLKKIIAETPNQFAQGLKVAGNIGTRKKTDSIVVCGMGGSAMPGYLLQTVADSKVPVFINNDYRISPPLTKNPLFFISSFSGNTEETLEVYAKAKKKYNVICFSNGGLLTKRCLADKNLNINYAIKEKNFQPRCALATAFSAMAKVAENSGLIEQIEKPLKEAASFLKGEIKQEIAKKSAEIAKKIKNKIPIFYTSYELRYVAMISKIKINENSKMPAFWNYYPELNHNEFNGYLNGDPDSFTIISLRDPDTSSRNIKREKITNEILTKMGYDVICIKAKGKNKLEKSFYLLNYSDWISYYLALSINQDPTPVEMVEKFKKKLIKN
jgi:glucose/mannose-6-phosphate isomerase